MRPYLAMLAALALSVPAAAVADDDPGNGDESGDGAEPDDDVTPYATGTGEESAPRPLHWSVVGGGYAAITGPASYGGAGVIDLYPGGKLGRFGARVHARGFETDIGSGMIAAGVSFEAASARPTLALQVYGELGGTFGDDPDFVLGVGIKAQLRVWGPFVLALDSGAHLYFDGYDTSLVLGSALLLGFGG